MTDVAWEEGDPDDAFDITSPLTVPGATGAGASSGKKQRSRPTVGRDKAKKKRALDDLAAKAAGNVKDFMSQSNKQLEVLSQQSAKKWTSIENAIVEMNKTSQQLVQMQLMERAPADERDRFFSLMRQTAMINAENDLAMAKSKNKHNDEGSGLSDNSDDEDSIDSIVN